MRGDGDGWTQCAQGHRHWGVHGAAGLLLAAPDDAGVVRVLLQHRAAFSHHGDTWGLPGGARGSAEPWHVAALREATEETGLDPAEVRVEGEHPDDHGGWAYVTVLARAARLLEVHAEDRESTAVAWVPVGDVEGRPLHPGFAASWPAVRERLAQLARNSANSSPGP
ncbi:MAG: hydrolase [Frankiales bacterium]|nr:hydrolase [Frankiales bacterium]